MSSLNNVLQAVNGFNFPESCLQVWMAHQNPPKLPLKRTDQIEIREWTFLYTPLTGTYEWNPAI